MGLVFEWDGNKAKQNLRKHGGAFEAASTVFGDPRSLTIADPVHATGEERFVTICYHRGVNRTSATALGCVHTARGTRIRGISARVATRRRQTDEENTTGAG